jgi:hypothetical protein
MTPKLPSTNSQIVNGQKLDFLMSYPPQALIMDFTKYTGSVLTISPRPDRNGNEDYVVVINNVLYEELHSGTDETIDLTNTGLNGIIDGITFTAADARDFLIWGLANDVNTTFQGFAATHKPFSAYTGPTTAAKGATVTFTGLTNAYQFTEGARVRVRNSVTNVANPFPYNGAPQYEWNWGTITSIVSNTSIQILMDNDSSYGVALSGATSGAINQWDKFRPWVVSSSGQELYSDSYRLLGELATNNTGEIVSAFLATDPWRWIPFREYYRLPNNNTNYFVSMGRNIPLWATTIANLGALEDSTALGSAVWLRQGKQAGGFQMFPQVLNVEIRATGIFGVGTNATVEVRPGTATRSTNSHWVYGYYVPGGMRL